jgi:hypothetical protein
MFDAMLAETSRICAAVGPQVIYLSSIWPERACHEQSQPRCHLPGATLQRRWQNPKTSTSNPSPLEHDLRPGAVDSESPLVAPAEPPLARPRVGAVVHAYILGVERPAPLLLACAALRDGQRPSVVGMGRHMRVTLVRLMLWCDPSAAGPGSRCALLN